MQEKLTKKLEGIYERHITMAVVLDVRMTKKYDEAFPVALRFSREGRSFYWQVGGAYTRKQFSDICNITKKTSPLFVIKQQWKAEIEKYANVMRTTDVGRDLSLSRLKEVVTGKVSAEGPCKDSFLGLWQKQIDHLTTTGRYSTAESYTCALRSFNLFLGNNAITGFNITIDDLRKWDDGMKEGKMVDKKLCGKLADATRGIYLRNCRAIWNICLEQGYLKNVTYPFSNKKAKGLIVIPKGNTRKASHLDVEHCTELYQVFMNKNYPETWSEDYTEKVHYSLGLFLVQYLCNGFNLADAAELTYDDYYFNSNGQAFRFERKKTRDRSENNSEVIVPIIPPLKNILDAVAAKPERGAFVFPDILKGATDSETVRKRISQENANVRHRLIRLCQEGLGWDIEPSGTWARHSFANNLRNAGVDKEYISESMGHSTGHSVTSIYLDSYPLEMQMEYNSKLLYLGAPKPTKVDIASMSPEQMRELLNKLLA